MNDLYSNKRSVFFTLALIVCFSYFARVPVWGADASMSSASSKLATSLDTRVATSDTANSDITLITRGQYGGHDVLKVMLKPYFSTEAEIRKVQDIGIKSGARYVPRYEGGQGSVGLGAGVVFPLFFQKFSGEISNTNLSVGGAIWFEWDIFLWKALSTGMELGGMFSLTPNSRSLFMAPITGHVKYTIQLYPVEIPISLSLGVNLSSIESNFKADFIVKPKVGLGYRINQNWVLGLYTSYWFVIQDYSLTLGQDVSRLGNFIDVTAGFSYVF